MMSVCFGFLNPSGLTLGATVKFLWINVRIGFVYEGKEIGTKSELSETLVGHGCHFLMCLPFTFLAIVMLNNRILCMHLEEPLYSSFLHLSKALIH